MDTATVTSFDRSLLPVLIVLSGSLVLAGLLAGCRPGYLTRVGIEHMRYVSRARSIVEELEATDDPVRQRRLRLVLQAREYASEQGLDVGGSYLEVADTAGLASAYVVTAAYVDRLEAYSWKYPIVGRIPYRGYFDRAKAEEFAVELEADGLDTHIVEAAGYSTLGWLDDPLPSGVLALDDVDVVTVVLHELVHQTLFVAGHIDFNETFASAVAGRLAVAFFEVRGETQYAEKARARHDRWLEQGVFLDDLVETLTEYFDGAKNSSRVGLRVGRQRIYDDAAARLRELGLIGGAEDDSASDMNNAVLLGLMRYRRRASLVDGYLATFARISQAIDALRAALDDHEDPYDALHPAASVVACCSRRRAVFLFRESKACG
jgi:predicted aminopeptidase